MLSALSSWKFYSKKVSALFERAVSAFPSGFVSDSFVSAEGCQPLPRSPFSVVSKEMVSK